MATYLTKKQAERLPMGTVDKRMPKHLSKKGLAAKPAAGAPMLGVAAAARAFERRAVALWRLAGHR